MNKLPDGWVETRLEDVVDILDNMRKPVNNKERQSRIADKQENELFPYYGATGQAGFIDDYLFDEELVALGEDGVPFFDGKKSKAYILNGKTWVNNHAHVIRGKEDFLPNKLLCHYLNQFDYHGYVNGGTRLKLTQANMRRMPVFLAPIPEQKRIVEKLDSLLAQVETIGQRLNNLPNIIKRFRQSVLAAAVSGKLTEKWREGNKFNVRLNDLKLDKNLLIAKKEIKKDLFFEKAEGTFAIPKPWQFIKLQSLAHKITDGEHKTPKREESGRFLLSARNVRDGYIDTSNVDYVGEEEYIKLRKRCNPNKGDVLISCSGSVGRVSLVDKNDEYVMVRSAALVKTLPEYISNKFLMFVLQSPHIQKQIVDASKSTAQENLFLGPIKNLFIPYLPMEEQTEIVRLVEQHFALADTLEKNLKNAKQRVDNLTQSILAKAFRGELVPQDPNDEPAEQLLARIKTARAEAELLEKAAKKATKKKKAKK
jgi:type I restriction enzyme S subunit